jgi:hypothetical protein
MVHRVKSPKSKWKFTKAGEEWSCLAGLWRPMPDSAAEAFALSTTASGPDVAPIRDRARPFGLARMARSHPLGTGSASSAFRRLAFRRAGPVSLPRFGYDFRGPALRVAAAASIWLITGAGASGQTSAYTASVEALCQQYAAAQAGMPVDAMFRQCMIERHCESSTDPSGYRCEPPGPMTWHGGGF